MICFPSCFANWRHQPCLFRTRGEAPGSVVFILICTDESEEKLALF